MIRIENTEVYGWEAAIRGMRNPMNSWEKSDSEWDWVEDESIINPNDPGMTFLVGENDFALMKKLANAGNDHGKFLRMIVVSCDITAPLYWVAEHDTYKIGTVRNSCSFMHRGTAKPFSIDDFSVSDERVYDVLRQPVKRKYPLLFPYETEEYKTLVGENGSEYKVYRNGRIIRCAFSYTDTKGRVRELPEKETIPSATRGGYYELQVGGRCGVKFLVHRIVATAWLDNPHGLETVNHINGNKGDNSVENLEWCSREENIKKAYESGGYEQTLRKKYLSWRNGHTDIDPFRRLMMQTDFLNGMSIKEVSEKYNEDYRRTNNVVCGRRNENQDLFVLCYEWERIIDTLNCLRDEYLDTKDEASFQLIRQFLPQGYNARYTWSANYQVLRNIYHSRKTHRLPEWHTFCEWIETLPYAELIEGGHQQ